ncbi:hypothetical protein HL666_09845 [Bradyrhizobium sp. 83002]|uniref:hypothetical protein n=1 Tax=Bradyrhizobium aeschynomenes TaxID=2734909 RepID=UPI001551AFDD|nr:hypothetical protein [Bradyrhizobium aeschynomenes]NPU11065.1 hypothetical protein [Bradyrhizobium aeschynomenes]
MTSTSNAVPIVFENLSKQDVWVQFLNGSFGPGQLGGSGTVPLSGNTGYALSALEGIVPAYSATQKIPNVFLDNFTNGRIYLNFGSSGLSGLGNGYQPAPQNPSDANYNTSYAYLETNIFGNTQNNLDISDIDFASMALEASTWRSGKQVGALKFNDSKPGAIGANMEALGTLSGGTAVVGNYVRVIGPGLTSGYPDWSAYFTFLASQGPTKIAGYYGGQAGGSGPTSAHHYALTASFGSVNVTLTGTITKAGSRTPEATTIVITYADLNQPTGVYGCNPSYTVNGGTPTAGIVNDVYGWIVGDLLAGLSYGFPGSTTQVTVDGKSTALGDVSSTTWFELAKSTPSLMFAGAQSNSAYYNQYAAQIAAISGDFYGFPFSDRVQQPLLYFPPLGQSGGVDYLKITILPVAYPA